MPIVAACALFFYLAATSLTAVRLGRSDSRMPRAPLVALATLALLAHAAAMAIGIGIAGGVELHFGNSLSLVGLGMALVLLVSGRRSSLEPLGVLVYPIAALCVLAMILMRPEQPMARPDSWQISLHGILALLSYSVLGVASLVAILMAVQEHTLRNHRPLPFLNTLPLTLTETLLFQLIGAGFALLSLSLVTGLLFVEDLFAQHLVHKTVLTVAAWVVFGILLLARWRLGLRGRRAAWLTLAGMALLLVGYFGVKLILAR
ncbi:MAG: cytochrome c biogenesis protein CcsA [Xanthomonadales bacterium]|nr:cytochrome c biogenesis protein CcsA [Xanthomonadales bacterium]